MTDSERAASYGVGQPVRRVEDRRLVTGQGRYTDDIAPADALAGYVVRSPHAHARLRGIDTARARAAPGVVAVLTGDDLDALGVGAIPAMTRVPGASFPNRDGTPLPDPPYYPLARGKVRFAGEAVAFIVAATRAQAQDAAEELEPDYEPLEAVIDAPAALAPGAARLWDDLPSNLCFDIDQGDAAAVEKAFAAAAHVVRVPHLNDRLIVHYMEPRAALAAYDPATGGYTIRCGAQSVQRQRAILARVLGVPQEKLRIVAADVGGAFGARSFTYPEYALCAAAAKLLGRPVRWRADRGESFLSDMQGRGHRVEAALALDAAGRFTAIRIESLLNIGAYVSSFAAAVSTGNMLRLATSVYAVPHAYVHIRAAFANCAPINAYRGVGRVEMNYAIERMVDAAARATGIDRFELRRRNFIAPAAMPYRSAAGSLYDSGEFAVAMDKALAAADRPGFAARRDAAAARGKLLGFGLGYYIEGAGGQPTEYAKLRAEPDGGITVFVGTHSQGQGHETSFAQVVAEKLGVPFARIRVIYGDTGIVEKGAGTHGSRSMRMAGSAMLGAAAALIEKGTALAGELLEAATADIDYAAGAFRVRGTDRAVTLAAVAAAVAGAVADPRLPEALREALGGELAGDLEYQTEGITFPNGCHVCEIEIDPETGRTAITRYTAVDDVGRVINPLIVHGQVHGGIAQGVGQALLERVVYDAESGQLLTGSLMDYGLPRADDLPFFTVDTHEVLCTTNPIGVKGAGEGGATGAPPAVISALLDALAAEGVTAIDMPATPEMIWRALQDARGR